MEQDRPAGASPARIGSLAEIAALATELGELARTDPTRLARRVAALSLREQAELALRLPAKERLELLLHAPQPMRLVRTLPDSELYLTVRELGPADALPLVALASAAQLQHLVDLESWRHDRFDAQRSGGWLALVLEAGEPALRRLLRAVDDDLLALLLQRWARTQPIESPEGPELHDVNRPEAGDERGLVSPDGAYHFRPIIVEHAPAVRRMAQMLFVDAPARYERILWASVWELPAELEEQALHWRSSRLEEHGFPPWEEALSVYAPPAGARVHAEPPPPADVEGLAAARAPLRLLEPQHLVGRALDELDAEPRERALHELISLANRLLVADGHDTGDLEAHRAALATAAGYVTTALEARGVDDVGGTVRLLDELPLIELFREGYARAATLGQRAARLARAGWASAHVRPAELLDSPLRERVEALAGPRPLHVELEEGQRPVLRPFRGLREIEESRLALELAELVGGVLVERLGLDLAGALAHRRRQGGELPRLSTLFLTALAWHAARGELRGQPLPADVVADFLRGVASRRTAAPDAPVLALEALTRRIERELGLGPRDGALLTAFGRAALERLHAACAMLDPGIPPDPRQVGCLLVEG